MNDREIEADLDDWEAVPVPGLGIDQDNPNGTIAAPPDEEYVDKLLYRATRLEAEAAGIRAIASKRRNTINAWEADRTGGIEVEVGRIRQSLEVFTRAWRRANPKAKRKSIPLPNGTLSLSSGKGQIFVQQKGLALAWLRAYRPDLIRMEPAIKKSVLSDENIIVRHTGPQINIDESGELYQSYRLMAEVPTCPVPACPECGVTFPDDDRIGKLWDPNDERKPPIQLFKCPSCGHEIPAVIERMSIPGVVFVELAEDRFDMKLTADKSTTTETEQP